MARWDLQFPITVFCVLFALALPALTVRYMHTTHRGDLRALVVRSIRIICLALGDGNDNQGIELEAGQVGVSAVTREGEA